MKNKNWIILFGAVFVWCLVLVLIPVSDTPSQQAQIKNGSMITVYDETMTQVRGTYASGTQAMLLRYGSSSCMIYVGGGVAYVSTWNVSY